MWLFCTVGPFKLLKRSFFISDIPSEGPLSRKEGNRPIRFLGNKNTLILNTLNMPGVVPSVIPRKRDPDKRLPDFLIAFLRCSLAYKPADLLRGLYQFLWKSAVKRNQMIRKGGHKGSP